MKVALTGATGLVGHFILRALLNRGDEVLALGRSAPHAPRVRHIPYDLERDPPPLRGCDALVHAAFSHVPGHYRGGEGDDPDGFLRRNLDGTLRLFKAARQAGVGRILFLSSRAVYGSYPPGTQLSEDMEPRPDSLYGQAKLEAEQALLALSGSDLATASLRATGVYGPPPPGREHKWQELFDRFAQGERIAPRAGTEVHGEDLAQGVLLLLDAPRDALRGGVFNISDFVLDRRELLVAVSRVSGISGRLPEAADGQAVNAMTTSRLRALGWHPRGPTALEETLRQMLVPLRP